MDQSFGDGGRATWSLKDKTYDPAVLKELEIELIPDSEINACPPPSISLPEEPEAKENVEPLRTVAKKTHELESSGHFVIRCITDRALTKVPYMDRFSDEIILMIFEWLPKPVLASCARVCKRWRRLAYDESLWQFFDLGSRRVESGTVSHLLSLGFAVLRFASAEFESPVMRPPTCIGTQSMNESKLQLLDLSNATISAEDLAALLSMCTSLRKISLSMLCVNADSCAALANNSRLDTLDMSMCHEIDQSISLVFQSCPLESVNISWAKIKDICRVLESLPATMRRLNVAGYRPQFGDAEVGVVVKNCPDLVNLDVSDNILITDQGLRSIISGLPQLEELGISRCLNLTNRALGEITKLKRLRSLQAFSCMIESSVLREYLVALPHMTLNKHPFSTIARPTVGNRRTSVWGSRTR